MNQPDKAWPEKSLAEDSVRDPGKDSLKRRPQEKTSLGNDAAKLHPMEESALKHRSLEEISSEKDSHKLHSLVDSHPEMNDLRPKEPVDEILLKNDLRKSDSETSAVESSAFEFGSLGKSVQKRSFLENDSATNSSLTTSDVEVSSPGAGVDKDPLFGRLRALPLLSPSSELTQRVAQAALAELTLHATSVSADSVRGWRGYVELALYRAALPGALAGATIVYLSWAITAASHLY